MTSSKYISGRKTTINQGFDDYPTSDISEFIGNPRGEIVYVLSRPRILEKPAGKKVGINGNKGDVPINVPLQYNLGLIPNIACCAVACGPDKYERVVINTVVYVLAPEEIPIDRKSNVGFEVEVDGRIDVDVVHRADQAILAEICPFGKEWVECLEIRAPRVVIATRDVCLQTESWAKRQGAESVPGVRCSSPCPDIAAAETSKLVNKFEVVIEGLRISP